MSWRRFLLLGLIWTFGATLSAQVQNLGAPFITNYEPEQYKAHVQNWVAVQDRRGVMYFGNHDGILEFDGYRWQLIPTAGKVVVRALTCGPDGTVYYGSIGDFGYLATSPSGKVSAVSLREAIPHNEQAFNDVAQVMSTSDGVYFLTRSRIFRFHDGRITALPGKFWSQACVLNGTLFYADLEKGIGLVDGDHVVSIPQLKGAYNGKRVTLAPFGRHELLVGRVTGDFLHINLEALWDEASQRYDASRQTPKDIVQPFPTELDDFIKESNGVLYKLVPLGADAFAICTLKGGIVTFDRKGKIIRSINTNSGLLDNTVADLFVDRTHNLWACNNAGISHIELSVPQSYFGARNNIRGITLGARFFAGRMYVGTFQNLFVQVPYRFTSENDQQVFKPINNSLREVWQLLEVEGDLMAASGQGLFQIQGEDAIRVQGSVINSTALCLATSKRWPNHLFVGFSEDIEVFKREAEPNLKGAARWESLGRMNGVKDIIRSIVEDVNGDLWIGTKTKGLLRIHFFSDNPTQVVIHHFGSEQGLPVLSTINTVSCGTTLYVLSPQGLFRTTIPSGASQPPEQIRFTPDTNLGKSFIDPPVALYAMAFNQDGSVFFNTSNGVVWAIPGHDGQYRLEKRPFLGFPILDETLYIHPDGSVWLPGKVLFRVDPKAPKDYDQPFDVLVRKVVTKSDRIVFEGTHGRSGSAFGQQRTVFESSQGLLDVPELPYRENALTFEFAAAFFEKPGTTQFQYLLEGFDKAWSKWTGETKKEYTNIPEGKYRFRVRAKNIYGTMGREAVYSLRILPPWYRTVWAYILWVVIGSAALFGIIHLYTLRLRRQKAHLETIVAERTQQLREASEQLREASLTDPLTGLRNRRFIAEVLQNDIAAFIGFKNYVLTAKSQRRSEAEDAVFGLFLLDIDFFKKVNDTYGHDAGDQVLKQFAAILTGSVRQDDAVMRVGGEEFLVVLKKTIPEYLSVFAAKILGKVAATPFDLGDGTTIQKTCSIGYTRFPLFPEQPGLLSFEQSIMVADLGLLHAKDHGRNQGVCLAAGPNTPSGKEVLQKSVTSREFALKEGYLQIGDPKAGQAP